MSFGDASYGQAVKAVALSSTGNVYIGAAASSARSPG
jgi:hypothetical protein